MSKTRLFAGILNHPYPGEKLETLLGDTRYGDVIRPIITEIMKVRHPDGFDMEIKSQDEWGAIAEAVNIGIDSRLEAFTRSTFDGGRIWIHPEEMGILLDRLKDIAVNVSNETYERDPGHFRVCNGDDCKSSKVDNLVRSIIEVVVRNQK